MLILRGICCTPLTTNSFLVGQDSQLVTSELLKGFLLSAQHETNCEKHQETNLEIYLMNGYQISLNVFTTDRSDQVLAKACKQINLPPEYINYFSLFLIKKEENNVDVVILRKLQDFESPYISHKSIQDTNKIVIRKRQAIPCFLFVFHCLKK